jgi:hypothetical protein
LELDFETLSQKTDGDQIASEMLPMLLMSEVPEGTELTDRMLLAERCLDRLRLMRIDRRIDDLRVELSEAQRTENETEVARLSAEQIELTRLKIALSPKAEATQSGH